MFGWVPSEVWLFIGVLCVFSWGRECIKIIRKERNKQIYLLPFSLIALSGVLLSIIKGYNYYFSDKVIYYLDNILFVVFSIGIISLFYIRYQEAKQNNEREIIASIEDLLKKLFIVMVIILLLLLFAWLQDWLLNKLFKVESTYFRNNSCYN